MLGEFEITAPSDGSHPFPIETVMTHIEAALIKQDLARAELAQPVQGSINAAVAPYQTASHYQPFEQFGQLDAGIEALPAPGHTPDHAVTACKAPARRC